MELPGSGEQPGMPRFEGQGKKELGGRGRVAVSMLLRAQKCGLRTQLGAGNAAVTANLGW